MPFPNDLQFDFEWQDPGGARGDELRATWASLSIMIGESQVAELQDKSTRSVRTRIFLPLFPLAEWIADNWWFLHSEVESPKSVRSIDFDRRHNIRWARDGFVLPSLRFVTLGENVEAQWQPLEVSQAAIRFLSSGQALLPAGVVTDKLRELVNAVISRLDESGITRTTLHEQWQDIQNADAEEREFCHAAARLGADPYAVDAQLEAMILDVARTVRTELRNDFLSLASAEHLTDQASALTAASQSIAADGDDFDALAGVRNRMSPIEKCANPWETGYRFATGLRRKLGGGVWKSRSLDELADRMNIDQLDRCLLQQSIECQFLDALAGSNQCNNPKFLIEKHRPDSRQFAFCRALFEHLTSPPGCFALVSRLRTERQQMNRAFAAEFLAPHEMLKGDLSAATVDEEEIEDLAVEYGVSAFVVRHQIENHRLARVTIG